MALFCRDTRSDPLIRVQEKHEYADFDAQVRRPGLAFLATCSNPSSQQFGKHAYWNRARAELHAAYDKVCAYTCIYLVDPGSVDHFMPKSIYPELAYEWNNYRLARGRFNTSKGNTVEVMDPFAIQNGWFVLDIPSCLVKASEDLAPVVRKRVNATINILRLNDDDYYVQERCDILVEYAKGLISKDFLKRRYPFLAMELERQALEEQLAERLGVGGK